jgi:pimeloyl-ACP methyl ester carboxylesterase
MPCTESEGAALHWESHGEGPPVVLVHGSGGNALSWWQQVPHLARRHRVLVYDQRGFGRSRCAPDARHPRFFASDLAAVLDAAGVERAVLVCQSLGGWTGLPFALAEPARCAGLLLCGTPGGLLTPGILRDLSGVPARMATRKGFAGMALGSSFVERSPDETFLYESIAGLNPPDTVAVYGRGLVETRVDPQALAGFRVPTLLLVGSEDAFFSVEGMREVAAAIPGARLHVVAASGHSPYFEAPEAFASLLDSFLEEIGWSSSS